MMPELDRLCDVPDRDRRIRLYVAGELPPAEADAFAEHCFGCDSCWEEVRLGTAIRAAASERIPPARARRWIPAVAAGLAFLFLATWFARPPADKPDAFRGGANPLAATASLSDGWVIIDVERPSGTTAWAVAIVDDGGRVLRIHQSRLPIVRIPRPEPGDPPMFFEARAVGPDGVVIARSKVQAIPRE